MLMTREQVVDRIRSGAALCLAGDEALLDGLPTGNWVGGTIPYFMDERGGTHSRELIFVSEMPGSAEGCSARWYDVDALPQLAADSPDHGFSLLVIPAGTQAHVRYAQESPDYPGLYLKNIVGWIAGFDLADLGHARARVYDGATGQRHDDGCVVLHVALPAHQQVSVGIVNCFVQGDGDVLTFPQDGFDIEQCLVNGQPQRFSEYLAHSGADLRLPLVADYNGEMINVSVQAVDAERGRVALYAPVFEGVEYRLAAPVPNYVEEFSRRLPDALVHPAFSCNCILNFLYSELEGKRTGDLVGPVTFGEIAYQLLNQTLVYVHIEDVPA